MSFNNEVLSALFIVNTNRLLVTCIADTISKFVGCLFSFLMESFNLNSSILIIKVFRHTQDVERLVPQTALTSQLSSQTINFLLFWFYILDHCVLVLEY